MSIKGWVVMGNDYPAGVFASERAADDFILFQRWWHSIKPDFGTHHVRWRHYEFTLDTEFLPETLKPGKGKPLTEMMSDDLRQEWWYWYSKEVGKSGAAAGAASEFRRNIETELLARGIDVQVMRGTHMSLADRPVGARTKST